MVGALVQQLGDSDVPRSLIIVSLALGASSGFAQLAGHEGVIFKSEAGKFSVRLPGNPQEKVKKLEGLAGKAEVHMFSVNEGRKERQRQKRKSPSERRKRTGANS